MRYEVIIERSQLFCGGRPPKQIILRSIETDAPFDYVLMNEPNVLFDTDFNIDESATGIITISFTLDSQRVKYEFIEDE